MRIGLLTEAYTPVVSGVTRSVALHKSTLEAMGHEPYVFTFGRKADFDDEPHVIRSPAMPLSDSGYHINFSFNRRARQLCRTMDVFHTQHPFVIGRLGIRYGERYGIPTIFTNHTRYDLLPRYYAPFISENLGAALLEAYLPSFAKKCELVITPTRAIRDLLRGYGVTQRIEVIPNGIDVARFQFPARVQDRASLGIPEGAQVLLYVGRIAPEKRVTFLLRAFAAVASDLAEIYLVFVGDGPEMDNLQACARQSGVADRVVFVGSVPYDDVPGYAAIADAFATASTSEVHPLSVLEALAAGLPVLGIRGPGVGEIVVDDRNGLLCHDDIAAFSVRMYRLMSDHDLCARLAQQARADSEQYNIKTTTRRIVTCYEEAIASYRARQTRERR